MRVGQKSVDGDILGEADRALYVIMSGVVKVLDDSNNVCHHHHLIVCHHHHLIVKLVEYIEAGGYFGEVSLTLDIPR